MPKSLRFGFALVKTIGIRNLIGLALLLLCAQSAFGQGAFISGSAQGTVNGALRSLPGATVTVCAGNTTGIPCSPALANTLFKDAALSQPLANPTTTDSNGNYNFAVAAGTYTLTITATGFSGSTQQISVTCATGGCAASSLTITGATTLNSLTVSGTGTFANTNGVIWVDGVTNTTIAAAVAAAGSNPAIIIIPSTYAGTECPASVTGKLTFWDYRVQGTAGPLCIQNTIAVNQTSGALQHAMLRPLMTRVSPASADVAVYVQSLYGGNLPSSSIEGGASEVDVGGTSGPGVVTNNTNAQVIAHEFDAVANANSTNQTIKYLAGTFTTNTIQAGTNVIQPSDVYGHYVRPITNNNTFVPTRVTGIWIEAPSSGTTQNSLVTQGTIRVDATGTGSANFVQIAPSGIPITAACNSGSNNGCLSLPNTAASGHTLNIGDGIDGNVGRFEVRDMTQAGAPYFAVDFTGMGSGTVNVFRPVTTANRTYTFPDANIAKVADTGTLTLKKGSGAGNYTTASTSYVAADTTNLCYTVTIPTGWKLGIQASGAIGTSTAVVQALVALADNSSCASTTSVFIQNQVFGNAAGNAEPFSLSWVINGDGASHNILLEFATTNAADSALMLNTSASFAPQMVFTLMPSN